jgi:hypothetical protein
MDQKREWLVPMVQSRAWLSSRAWQPSSMAYGASPERTLHENSFRSLIGIKLGWQPVIDTVRALEHRGGAVAFHLFEPCRFA